MSCGCGGGGCVACAPGGAPLAPMPPGGCSGPKLAQRLAPVADRLRARYAAAGLRPYDVWLVWTVWSGAERGEGTESVLRRVPILPHPKVSDLTSVALSPYGAGILPVGSVRLEEVTTRLTQDDLMGKTVPGQPYYAACGIVWPGGPTQTSGGAVLARTPGAGIGHDPLEVGRIPQPVSFFYEVVQNDVVAAPRAKFRLLSVPFKRAGNFDWVVPLERISEDLDRRGRSQAGTDADLG